MSLHKIAAALPERLLPWYQANARPLPWRTDRDPYHILLSEIMLQQTRVEAVKTYYLRFLEVLPTVESLAAAEEQTLLKLWEGLGYYSRVRNLQKAAKAIVAQGSFPQDSTGLLALPGVGPYTAGAVGSICFELPTPAVDGNVLRLMTRLAALETPINDGQLKRDISDALAAVYPAKYCGDFTQALMELGATICSPNGAPDCNHCPVQSLCQSADGAWERIPVRPAKRSRRQEQHCVLILRCENAIALQKRPNHGLLAGLWELPNQIGFLSPQAALDWAATFRAQPVELIRELRRRHIFSHVEWDLQAYEIRCQHQSPLLSWQSPDEAALPTAFRILLED